MANTARRSCKYWAACGSNDNCGGYEPRGEKKTT